MIYVNRSSVAIPAALNGPTSLGGEETAAAIAHYINPTANPDKPKFEAYKHETVKDKLEILFHKKCAYCESIYGPSQPVDVEHYRPKGKVKVKTGPAHSGYYWLAASWDNLLPSCIDCNRSRTYKNPSTSSKQVAGKACHFPIVDEETRAKQPGQEAQEESLLLNPCNEDPEPFLKFQLDGMVIPQCPIGQSNKGEVSINICALFRPELAKARQDHAVAITAQLVRCYERSQEICDFPTVPNFVQKYDREVDALFKYLEPQQKYVAMAGQIILEELVKNLRKAAIEYQATPTLAAQDHLKRQLELLRRLKLQKPSFGATIDNQIASVKP